MDANSALVFGTITANIFLAHITPQVYQVMMVMKIRKIIGPGACLALLLTQDAHAYMDPGSGSLFLQMLLGGIAGAVVALKMYWHRVIGFFKNRKSDK